MVTKILQVGYKITIGWLVYDAVIIHDRKTANINVKKLSDGVKDTDGKAKAKDISHEVKTKAKDLTLKAQAKDTSHKAKAKDIQHKPKSLCHGDLSLWRDVMSESSCGTPGL